MRITVMGVLIVIGGILLVALFVDHVHGNLNKNDERNLT